MPQMICYGGELIRISPKTVKSWSFQEQRSFGTHVVVEAVTTASSLI
jgi:hypothetical protein